MPKRRKHDIRKKIGKKKSTTERSTLLGFGSSTPRFQETKTKAEKKGVKVNSHVPTDSSNGRPQPSEKERSEKKGWHERKPSAASGWSKQLPRFLPHGHFMTKTGGT